MQAPANEQPTMKAPSRATSARPLNVLNPFDVSGPYAAAMRLALAMALLPGLGTGLLLVLIAGAGLPLEVAWPQLAQAHGQIQALGFVLVFIVAVALQLFPRFLGAPVEAAQRATWGAAAISLGLLIRLVAQPLAPGALRTISLTAAAIIAPAGVLLAASTFHGLQKRSVQPAHGPSAAWRQFVVVSGLTLGAALLLSEWSVLQLASGEVLVSQGMDEALIHLELAGFASGIVYAVASRVFGRFLLLRTRPALDTRLRWLATGWGVGVALTALGWLLVDNAWSTWLRFGGAALEVVILLVWLYLSGLYEPPARASGTPYVTNPTRRWVRLSFLFLALGVGLNALLFGREALLGAAPTSAQLNAARHALGQGFLLPLMVSMAARLLPIYSADVLKHKPRLELTVDLLLLGALLRVPAELLGDYGPVSGPLIALGGLVSFCGFAIFAVGMWSSLTRLPNNTR
jgi:hypothetical protein